MTHAFRRNIVAALVVMVLALSASRAHGQETTTTPDPEPFVDVSFLHASNNLWTTSTFSGVRLGAGEHTSEHSGWRVEADIPRGSSPEPGGQGSFSIFSASALYGYHFAPARRVDVTLLVGGAGLFLDRNAVSAGTGMAYADSLFAPALALGADAAVQIARGLTLVPSVRLHEELTGHRMASAALGVRWTFTGAHQRTLVPKPARQAKPRASRAMPIGEFEASLGTVTFPYGKSPARWTLHGTLNANEKWAVEGGLDKATDGRFYPMFYVQAKRLIAAPAPRTKIFATFGAGWLFEPKTRYNGGPYTYLDSGRGGLAVERALSRHLALRADVQGVFYGVGDGGAALGVRSTVGIVVPFGHY